jgi:hypothetical protein
MQGVQIVRVHDAFETAQALRIWRGLRDEALAPSLNRRGHSPPALSSKFAPN